MHALYTHYTRIYWFYADFQVLPETKGRSFQEIANDFRKAGGLGDPLLSPPPKPPAYPWFITLFLSPFSCIIYTVLQPLLYIIISIISMILGLLYVITGIGPLYEWYGSRADESILSPAHILKTVTAYPSSSSSSSLPYSSLLTMLFFVKLS